MKLSTVRDFAVTPGLPPAWRIDMFRPGRWIGRHYISFHWVAFAVCTGAPGGDQAVMRLRGFRGERLRARMARRIEAEDRDWPLYVEVQRSADVADRHPGRLT